ncbi:MAG TPA: DUF2182 domain-containing protein [Arachnia sp.]|nr:DUF2182 domain-containing protein [Arachnia sp.]HMT86278.1 DUF2182 domain-containing protein [Arachnia sp.]
MATTLPAQAPLRRRAEVLGRRPEFPALAVAAVAWVALLAMLVAPPPVVATTGGAGHHHAGSTGAESAATQRVLADAGQGVAVWVLMVVAMMLPLAVPGIRYVARMVPRRGRLAATSTFAAAYVVAWLPGAILAVGLHAWPAPGWPVVSAGFLLAAAWELTPLKRKALLRCHRRQVIRARQPARWRSCWAFGLRRGGWCVVSCGPAMLALMLSQHALVPLLVLAAGVAAQQYLPDAHWHRKWSAAALLALAVATPMFA